MPGCKVRLQGSKKGATDMNPHMEFYPLYLTLAGYVLAMVNWQLLSVFGV
jgi:hypothetical protein